MSPTTLATNIPTTGVALSPYVSRNTLGIRPDLAIAFNCRPATNMKPVHETNSGAMENAVPYLCPMPKMFPYP
eukprot:CAMPEP_0175004168 /NCGR_PEP_ID=MMETSP0005-20121125/4617_1 /TAXON_ID=420556 /ORGANISM="Ochromonas sp., Strain CCMP1393" /LENGTH=72 /DNA_ID=CAMNT_0016259291 /DNA_START=64 /DNA_END=282 /DNA_ORIENTATION=-